MLFWFKSGFRVQVLSEFGGSLTCIGLGFRAWGVGLSLRVRPLCVFPVVILVGSAYFNGEISPLLRPSVCRGVAAFVLLWHAGFADSGGASPSTVISFFHRVCKAT